MAQGTLKELNKLAGTCGTRFVRDAIAGRLVTKHPIAWKNALWLSMQLTNQGYKIPRDAKKSNDQFYVYVEL